MWRRNLLRPDREPGHNRDTACPDHWYVSNAEHGAGHPLGTQSMLVEQIRGIWEEKGA